jgi:crossover junction endodeoxyribonuclease RusA
VAVLPIEFTVRGPPTTLQTKKPERRHRWRERVQDAARTVWRLGPQDGPVRVRITYYHDADSPPVDADNIIKPIQDALSGIIYVDDKQVTDVDCAKRNIDGSFRIKNISPVLAAAFSEGVEFIHIRVERAPNPKELR